MLAAQCGTARYMAEGILRGLQHTARIRTSLDLGSVGQVSAQTATATTRSLVETPTVQPHDTHQNHYRYISKQCHPQRRVRGSAPSVAAPFMQTRAEAQGRPPRAALCSWRHCNNIASPLRRGPGGEGGRAEPHIASKSDTTLSHDARANREDRHFGHNFRSGGCGRLPPLEIQEEPFAPECSGDGLRLHAGGGRYGRLVSPRSDLRFASPASRASPDCRCKQALAFTLLGVTQTLLPRQHGALRRVVGDESLTMRGG